MIQVVTGCLRTAYQDSYKPRESRGCGYDLPMGADLRPHPRTLGRNLRPIACEMDGCDNDATIFEHLDPADGHGDGIAVCAGCAFGPRRDCS